MKIVLASSEAIPFAKTGGLADVASALSKALAEAGHEVSLFLPYYPQSTAKRGFTPQDFETCQEKVTIAVGSKDVEAGLLKATFPDSNVSVYLVEQPRYLIDRNCITRRDAIIRIIANVLSSSAAPCWNLRIN